MAHSLSAQIDVDRGQAERAMVRLIERLRQRGPHAEIYAGLVQACRFGGLLEASAEAHDRAHHLDPALATSVMHTYFVMGRFGDVIAVSGDVKGYVFALSLAALGRGDEARAVTATNQGVASPLKEMLIAVGALIEGRRADSVRALASATKTMADPEAFFYAARHFAHLEQPVLALEMLTKSIAGGYFGYEPLTRDPWFDSIRRASEFQGLVNRAREGHESAVNAFQRSGGTDLLPYGGATRT